MDFRSFINEANQNTADVHKLLGTLPKKHADLIRGYTFTFEPDNALKGDHEHVGVIDDKKRTVRIAGSWNYGRSFVVLHELAHLIWKTLNKDKRHQWNKLAKGHHLDDSIEEVFCHAYAATYCGNPPAKFDFKEWKNFIKQLT